MTAKTHGQIMMPPRTSSRKKVLGSAAAAAVSAAATEPAFVVRRFSKVTNTVVFGRDYNERVSLSRAGLPAISVDLLAERLGLSRVKFVTALGLKGSTIERRLATKQPLSPAETDKLYRVEKVLSRAIEVLEDEEAAKAWLQREIRSLGGVSPLSLLDTDAGVDLVMDTLGRIEYGIAA